MATVRYYKGVHKVRTLTKSEGYLIVEALEDFEDTVNNERIHVKTGEKRIVPIENIYKKKRYHQWLGNTLTSCTWRKSLSD